MSRLYCYYAEVTAVSPYKGTEVTVTAVSSSPAAGEDQFTARTAPTEVGWSVAAGVPAEPSVDTTAALQHCRVG